MSEENKALEVQSDTGLLLKSDITDLTKDKTFIRLAQKMPEHAKMVEVIKEGLPEILRGSSIFYKTQSQFMDNMMTVSSQSPIRNARQLLAEMERTRQAIKEAQINLAKKDTELRAMKKEYEKGEGFELRKKRVELSALADKDLGKKAVLEFEIADLESKEPERIELLQADMIKIASDTATTENYMSGAIRKLANATVQYQSILEKKNIKEFTEKDFEDDEERYHIMKVFEQGLCAARSKPDGKIDEGNHIYLWQLGINGEHAQMEIDNYVRDEKAIAGKPLPNPLTGKVEKHADGKPKFIAMPVHSSTLRFLERMADTFAGSAKRYAEYKGMTPATELALLGKGDTTYLQIAEDKQD